MAPHEQAPSSVQIAQLCARCRGLELLGTENFQAVDFEDEWPTLSGLKQSAATGCDFCRTLCPIISTTRAWDESRVRIIIRPTRPNKDGLLRALRVYSAGSDEMQARDVHPNEPHMPLLPGWWVRATFLLYLQVKPLVLTLARKVLIDEEKQPCKNALPFSMLSPQTTQVLSDRNVAFFQKHIAESVKSEERSAISLPTRLLDLAEAQSGRVQLVISARIHCRDAIRYAALSYCWGNAHTAKHQSITTFSNLEERKSGIEIRDLSPVIQDAAEVCTTLGIRYLWVDALCILQAGTLSQGSQGQEAANKDWDFESQRLWQNFRGAYITICAASSESCQNPFLQDRQPQSQQDVLLNVRLRTKDSHELGLPLSQPSGDPSDSPVCEIRSYRSTGPWRFVDEESPFLQDILSSRWYSRGWVHQEISFSKRLLVFGTDIVYLRCGDFRIFEDGWRDRGQQSYLQWREIDPEDFHREPFRRFSDNVKALYTKQFTAESDRLPAIAALASQVAKVTKSQYLAGLWRKNLANDLLFHVFPHRNDLTFESRISELSDLQSIARPSWSWAGHGGSSIDRGFREARLQMLEACSQDCEIIEAIAIPVGKSPFGRVAHAHLSLRCRVAALEDLAGVKPSEGRTSMQRGHLDPASLKGLKMWWDTNNDACPASIAADISLICTSKQPAQWLGTRDAVAGLIVYPAEDGKFYRIGMWEEYLQYEGGRLVVSCVENHLDWESRIITLV